MRALLIARIMVGDRVEKYRLLGLPEVKNFDARSKFEVLDVTAPQIIAVVKTGKLDIANIKVENNTIKGNGASLDRYTKIDANTNGILGKAPMVVIKQIKQADSVIGYVVSDFKGKVVNGTLNNVMQYANSQGIANGR